MGAYDAVIEIPRNSKIKYEVDHGTGRVFLDRILYTPMGYPTNYGFFENTLGEDGDPLDVLVLLDHDLAPGILAKVRPVGVLKMSDEAGSDEKLLAVPVDKVFAGYSHIDDIARVSPHWLERIGHFFEHYKDLEKGKWVRLDGWGGADEARAILGDAIARYNATPEADKPHF